MRTYHRSFTVGLGVVLLMLGSAFIAPADAASYSIGYSFCPSGATLFSIPDPLDPTSSAQAQLACDTCFGDPCSLALGDSSGPGWGHADSDATFGYSASGIGPAGRVWRNFNSYTT